MKKLLSFVVVLSMLTNAASPALTAVYADDNTTAVESTSEDDTGEDESDDIDDTAVIETVSAGDNIMSAEYLRNHKVSCDSTEDNYIVSYSNNGGQYSKSYLQYAFDGDWTTHWETGKNSVVNYIDTVFNKPTKIDRILYATRQDISDPKGYPLKLTIYSYNSATKEWDRVAYAESEKTRNRIMITLPQATEFERLRFEFTEAYNQNWASASELEFLRPDDSVISGGVEISGSAAIGKTLTANTFVDNATELSYRWQYSEDGTTFTDIEGATSQQYTITDDRNFYRVVVSDSTGQYYGTLVSELYGGRIATILSGNGKIGALLGAEAMYVDENEKLTYKWQYSVDNVNFKDIADVGNVSEYIVPVEMGGSYIRAGITANGSDYAYSDGKFIDARAIMTGAPQVGSELKASLSGYNDGLSYVWQKSEAADGEFTDIADAASESYELISEDKDSFVRVKITVDKTGSELVSESWQIGEEGSCEEFTNDYVYLSDLPDSRIVSKSIGYSTLKKDTNIDGGMITLLENGVKKYFYKGIGAHAPSTLVYDVSYYVEKYQFNRFQAYLGLDASVGTAGNGAKIIIYTSSDNTTWKEVKNTGILKGTSEAVYADIDISEAKYIKIVTNANGNNDSDHTVLGGAMLCKESYTDGDVDLDFIKSVSEYDKLLKSYGTDSEVLLKNDEYRKLMYQRTFVERVDYNFIKELAKYDPQVKKTIEWLFDDVDNLELYIMGGEPSGTYNKSIEVLGELLEAHGEDINDETYGDLYKRMIITLSLTHSKTVRYWIGDKISPEGVWSKKNISDPVRRYEIYKKMLLAGKLSPIFNDLTVEEMRLVMNTKMSDYEIEWFRDYIYTRSGGKGISGFSEWWITYNNSTWLWQDDMYYDPDTIESYSEKYGDFLKYGVPVEKYAPSLWMVYDLYGICWHISNASSNAYAVYGIPTMTLGQPGHVCYIYATPDSDGNVTWNGGYFVGGWSVARFETFTGDAGYYNQRPLNDWGLGSYQNFTTDASYVWLAQRAMDDYDAYTDSQTLMLTAKVYNNDVETQRELYNKAIAANKYNFDAYLALANSYFGDDTITDEQRYELATQIVKAMPNDPLPVYDLWEILNNQIADDTISIKMNILKDSALKSWQTSEDNNVRNVATLVSGVTTDGTVATFSFDGDNANTISLSEQYSGVGVNWDFSVDGGKNWIPTDGDSITLTDEQLAEITADNDIKIHIMGLTYDEENIFTIDITKASLPSNLYGNDQENRVIGATMNTNMEWSVADDTDTDVWTDFDSVKRFAGDITIKARVKAKGTALCSDTKEFKFTENNDTPQKSYVTLDRFSLVGYSTQQSNSSAASMATDGNINTIWHTSYSNNTSTDSERYLKYEFAEPIYLTSMDYTPRQNGTNGNFTTCELYISEDGESWTLVGTGSGWANNAAKKTLALSAPVYTKYVKVVGKVTSGNFGAASMIEFYENTELKDKTEVAIELTAKPTKLEYVIGQSIDLSGMVVKAVYDDGSVGLINNALFTVEDVDMSSEGEKTVTVAYKDMTVQFNINVTGTESCEAYIGDYPYFTFADAWKDAKTNDVITVCKNITIDETLSLAKNVTIASEDGNTFVISRGSGLTSSAMFAVTSGSLTLKNVILDGGAVWNDGANAGLTSSAALVTMKGGTLVLDEGSVLRNNVNTATWETTGGAINGNNCTVKLTGGTIENNKSSVFGGAMYIGQSSKFIMESGTITNNTSDGSGGALCLDHSTTLTMTGGVIENNTNTASNGGAVWISNGAANVSGGVIKNNSAAGNGSAIQLNDSSKLAIGGHPEIVGEINTGSKLITVDGDLSDCEISLRVSGSISNGTSIATVTEKGNAYNAAKALTVDGYYSYVSDSNICITKDDLSKDINLDGKINDLDAVVLLKYISDIPTGYAFDVTRADVNGDNAVDMIDVITFMNEL